MILADRVYEAWSPPPQVCSREWIGRHVLMPEGTETPGPIDFDAFPHVPEVFDTLDQPHVRRVVLCWAARLGKTMSGIAYLTCKAKTSPRPMLFGSSNEDRADDTIQSQIYPLLEACHQTRDMLLPPHLRNKKRIEIGRCRIRRAYSGSANTMAGFPACYGLASEVSKWSKAASTEADPVLLFSERFKLFPFESKQIFESTPGLKGKCNITALMSRPGTDVRKRHVPCPHCKEYQVLVWGSKDDPDGPGVKWDKLPNGRSDVDLAEASAYYQCKNGCRIENSDRAEMMRAGVWLSGGQTVTRRGKVKGKRPDSSAVAFGPLSTLYSLVISGWGQLAREFLEAVNDPDREALRSFINSVLAEVWDPTPIAVAPHELADRLCSDEPSGRVPVWGRFVTIGCDVQDGGRIFKWVATAWGDGGPGMEIDHGTCETFDQFRPIHRRDWPHADGGKPCLSKLTLVDSGAETETVYQLCRTERRMFPCKGANHPFPTEYRDKTLSPEQRRNDYAVGDVRLIEINTDWTQRWLERHIAGRVSDNEPRFWLSADCALDLDFLDELLNERSVEEFDKNGYLIRKWVRRVTHQPNDFRDALRYAKTAASILTAGGRRWDSLPQRYTNRKPPQPEPSIRPTSVRTPDGRPFFATER